MTLTILKNNTLKVFKALSENSKYTTTPILIHRLQIKTRSQSNPRILIPKRVSKTTPAVVIAVVQVCNTDKRYSNVRHRTLSLLNRGSVHCRSSIIETELSLWPDKSIYRQRLLGDPQSKELIKILCSQNHQPY